MIKILVVDDEPDVEPMFRQKFRSELKNGEIDMQFVLSAQEALRYMSTLTPFDIVLVLSDVNMPGMSGFELLKEIREVFPELRVFMITAYGDKKYYEEAIHLGANEFITKPVDFQILKQRITEISAN